MVINTAALAEDSAECDFGALDAGERHSLSVDTQGRLDMHRRARRIPRQVPVDGFLHIRQTQCRSAHVAGLASGGEVSRCGRRRSRAIADTLQISLLQKCITSRDAASNHQKREDEATQNQRNRRATVIGQPLARIHGATTR